MNTEISGNYLETICNIAQVIIAVINIIMILYIFCSDRGRYKREYESSKETHWFHNIVMDQNLLKITKFYDNYLDITLDNSIPIKEKLNKLGSLGLDFEQNVLTFISIVNKPLNEFITNNIEEIEDLVSDNIQKMASIAINNTVGEESYWNESTLKLECSNKIQKAKKDTIHKIYTIDLDLSPYNKRRKVL